VLLIWFVYLKIKSISFRPVRWNLWPGSYNMAKSFKTESFIES